MTEKADIDLAAYGRQLYAEVRRETREAEERELSALRNKRRDRLLYGDAQAGASLLQKSGIGWLSGGDGGWGFGDGDGGGDGGGGD